MAQEVLTVAPQAVVRGREARIQRGDSLGGRRLEPGLFNALGRSAMWPGHEASESGDVAVLAVGAGLVAADHVVGE